jgi:hypothetical protein
MSETEAISDISEPFLDCDVKPHPRRFLFQNSEISNEHIFLGCKNMPKYVLSIGSEINDFTYARIPSRNNKKRKNDYVLQSKSYDRWTFRMTNNIQGIALTGP